MQNLSNKHVAASAKISTGQSFLYRKEGFESMVIEVKLTDIVSGIHLKTAFAQAIKRYPYLAQQFVEVAGDFFLVKNEFPFVIRNSRQLLPLGGAATNEHLIDVQYAGQTVLISYHHGLADGRGMMPFVRTLLYYYCTLHYQKPVVVPTIQLSQSPLLPAETTNPAEVSLSDVAKAANPIAATPGFCLPEASLSEVHVDTSTLQKLTIDSPSFMRFAHSIGATPAIAMNLLVSQALHNAHPHHKAPIIGNLVVDLRAAAHLENTHRNCVASLEIAFEAKEEYQNLAKKQRYTIRAYKAPENLRAELAKIVGLSQLLDTKPNFAEKKQTLAFYDTLRIDTFILSYIGRLELGDFEQYIAEFHTYISGTPGLSIEMLATKEHFFLDWLQNFENEQYVAELQRLFAHYAIGAELTAVREIRIPRDALQN
jgi:hypothetical protein